MCVLLIGRCSKQTSKVESDGDRSVSGQGWAGESKRCELSEVAMSTIVASHCLH